jgi:hypothetical protein
MKRFWLFTALLALVVMSGCAFNQVLLKDRDSSGMALFYGYVGFKNNSTWLSKFVVKRLDIQTDKPYYWCGIYRDVYFMYLPVGTYRVDSFQGTLNCGNNCITTYNYNMPAQQDGFEIKTPGLYFFSSVRIENKEKMFSTDFDYEVEKAEWPSEEQIIERLLDIAEKGSTIEKILLYRLSQYRNLRKTNAKTTTR